MTMRIIHKPGDAMQVDWAGTTIPVTNSYTGEISNTNDDILVSTKKTFNNF